MSAVLATRNPAVPIAEVKLVNYDIRVIAPQRNAWIAKWKEMYAAR